MTFSPIRFAKLSTRHDSHEPTADVVSSRTLQSAALALLSMIGAFSAPRGFCQSDPPTAQMPAEHANFFKDFCLECHDGSSNEGQVNLETLPFDLDTLETAENWQKVLTALNSGEMPPAEKTQPSATEKTSFLQDLSQQLVNARKLLSDTGGKITMRRLNRREYANTIRELLGTEVDVTELPDDANSAGFDTAGDALFISSDQIEKYLQIGRRALNEIARRRKGEKQIRIHRECEKDANRVVRNRHAKLTRQHSRAQQYFASDRPPTDFGFIDDSRVKFEEGQYRKQFPGFDQYLQWPEAKSGIIFTVGQAGAFMDITTLPKHAPSGTYRLRARVGTLPTAASDRCCIELGTIESGAPAGEIGVLDCRKIVGTFEQPEIIEFSITLATGREHQIALRERQHNSRDAARAAFNHARKLDQPLPPPAIWVDWVEIEGPLPNTSAADHFVNSWAATGDEDDDAAAKRIVTDFANRAFRGRKPAPAYLEKLMQTYRSERAQGQPFTEALVSPLAIILASPSFLYLREPNDSSKERQLSDLELAARLSYFLWSGPPDAELLRVAMQEDLSDPQALAAQTNRLLGDPRSMEFVKGFIHQWLEMDRLDFFQFNYRRFPQFDESAKIAAREEIYQTFAVLIRQHLGIGKLLTADFVVINDLLADYYELPPVEGSQFRTVKLPANSPRGGLLGTAAVLAMGADGERTSPVERGAWILRKLLHAPPPPAPANVPQLSRLEGQLRSARELQSAHMEEPQCAQCHHRIDPLGYGLENFDAAGRWRDVEVIEQIVKKKIVQEKQLGIDSSGRMPDGTPFDNYQEMRECIASHESQFARGFSEALIAYGIGRPYGFSDFDLCEEILAKAKADDHTVSSFIHALVQSKTFQRK